jgi:hypothetical protein
VDADVKVAAHHDHRLGLRGPDRAEPIFAIPRHTVAADDVPRLAADVDALLARWSELNEPDAADGTYVFALTVYAARPANTGPPVLELQNLVYSLT